MFVGRGKTREGENIEEQEQLGLGTPGCCPAPCSWATLPMTQLASSTLTHQVPGLREWWQPSGGTSKGHPPSREGEGRTRPGCSRDSNPLGSQTSLKKLTWERASVGLKVPYLGSNHPVSDLMGQGQGPSNESLTLHLPSGRPGQTPPPQGGPRCGLREPWTLVLSAEPLWLSIITPLPPTLGTGYTATSGKVWELLASGPGDKVCQPQA